MLTLPPLDLNKKANKWAHEALPRQNESSAIGEKIYLEIVPIKENRTEMTEIC